MESSSKIIKARDWNEIKAFYQEINVLPMVDLISHIIKSNLGNRLYAYTSVYFLGISIYENIEPNNETLKIEFNKITQKWHFKYYPKPFADIEFEREYSKELGVEKFNQFIELIKW